jgi:hypothetical protein
LKKKLQDASSASRHLLDVCSVKSFCVFVTLSSSQNLASLSRWSHVFETVLAMYRVSVLQDTSVLSTFHIEKQTLLLSFSDVNRGRKKVNKCKDLKGKQNFTVSKVTANMTIKKYLTRNQN